MSPFLLRWLYGAIVISSGFLVGSMSRLALREMVKIGLHEGVRSIYVWLAANMACESIALLLICGLRLWDAFHGEVAGADWGWPIVLGFSILFLMKLGFTWAGTARLHHGGAIWHGYVLSLIGWTAYVAWWTMTHLF